MRSARSTVPKGTRLPRAVLVTRNTVAPQTAFETHTHPRCRHTQLLFAGGLTCCTAYGLTRQRPSIASWIVQGQKSDVEACLAAISIFESETPYTDYLLRTNKYASNIIAMRAEDDMRKKEKELAAVVDEPREMLRRMRIAFANKGRKPWNDGVEWPEETKARIAVSTREAMQRDDVRKRLSEVQQGRLHSEDTKDKIREKVRQRWLEKGVKPREPKPKPVRQPKPKPPPKPKAEPKPKPPKPVGPRTLSDEHRRRISESMRRKWLDDEYRRQVERSKSELSASSSSSQTQRRGFNFDQALGEMIEMRHAIEDKRAKLQTLRAKCMEAERSSAKLRNLLPTLVNLPLERQKALETIARAEETNQTFRQAMTQLQDAIDHDRIMLRRYSQKTAYHRAHHPTTIISSSTIVNDDDDDNDDDSKDLCNEDSLDLEEDDDVDDVNALIADVVGTDADVGSRRHSDEHSSSHNAINGGDYGRHYGLNGSVHSTPAFQGNGGMASPLQSR